MSFTIRSGTLFRKKKLLELKLRIHKFFYSLKVFEPSKTCHLSVESSALKISLVLDEKAAFTVINCTLTPVSVAFFAILITVKEPTLKNESHY
jgi:hypothetical protein